MYSFGVSILKFILETLWGIFAENIAEILPDLCIQIHLAMRKILFLLFMLTGAYHLYAQVIFLNNASFEGEPVDATMPVGWFGCTNATTPDILPGPWGVYEEPSDGDTFVGLITREDGTWEAVGQRFSEPLKKGECYAFTIDLAHSGMYADYNTPIRLRIWGGKNKCDLTQLLFESPVITKSDWTTFSIEFFADQVLNYIRLEACRPEKGSPVRGNVLIDNISPIKRCARAGAERERPVDKL